MNAHLINQLSQTKSSVLGTEAMTRFESQDSQAILDALKAELGVSTTSNSPVRHVFKKPSFVPAKRPTQVRCWPAGHPQIDKDVTDHIPVSSPKKHAAGSTTINKRDDVKTSAAGVNAPQRNGLQHADNPPDTAPVDRIHHDDDATAVTSEIHHEKRSVTLSAENRPSLAPGPNMDSSQQTPTQINEGRDYETFCEPLSSSLDDRTQSTSSGDPRTLQPDDTGAVNFGSLSEFPRPSSQVSEDGGFENSRGQWRLPADATTPYKPHDTPVTLETPALSLSKNPFGTKSNDGAVPFEGTQLFGQTQMLSSAVKLATPTSTRPSPAVVFNLVETSPLKNRTNVSSPTVMQTSSPTRLTEIPDTILIDKDLSVNSEETPVPVPPQSPKDDLILESPTSSRLAVGRQPMAYYEPMKHSQERKGSDERLQKLGHHVSNSDSEDETFQLLERKRRVERKRAAAAKELDKVSFVRTQRKPLSPPSERPGKRRKVGVTADHDKDNERKADGMASACVRDSQKAVSQSSELPSARSTEANRDEQAPDVEDGEAGEALADDGPTLTAQIPESTAIVNDEIIPATSPVRSSSAVSPRDAPWASDPQLPMLKRSETEKVADSTHSADSSSLPPTRQRPCRTYGRRARAQKTRLALASTAETDANGDLANNQNRDLELRPAQLREENNHDAETEKAEDAAKPPSASSSKGSHIQPPTRRLSTRSTPRRSDVAHHRAVVKSSSLTDLSGTPAPSFSNAPDTDLHSAASKRPESINLISSERSTRTLRKGTTHPTATPESPQPLTKAMRLSRRTLRLDSDSTDELHRSPSRSNRSFRPSSLSLAHRSRRLFEGMVFALSFSDNQTQRAKLEVKITQAGGFIVHEGFQELFEPSPVLLANSALEENHDGLTLARANVECGFAAVIADSHSRKAKYMQALALGLPCLAPQWANMCLKKGEIVDWTPYLLCAGQSQVLGNAVRSRNLSPYDALNAKLADILEERNKLLDGEKLLIIVDHKKLRKDTKQQYLFLALALGPSVIYRVSTVQDAGGLIRQAEQSGSPFGWVYMDSSTGTRESVLAAAQKTGKRKRRSGITEPVGETLNVLTDELMIQSLILGRMVEEDEMS
ncbi:hypothetical protein E4U55_002316 [Claviceps digitariae]|nr:hypothetical protein E4U55_002316 [Claviceps digitariae]